MPPFTFAVKVRFPTLFVWGTIDVMRAFAFHNTNTINPAFATHQEPVPTDPSLKIYCTQHQVYLSCINLA